MNEILFKAKRTDNHEWCEGYFEESKGKSYIVSSDIKLEIDKETICRYTNLCDENHEKIFDGDIVETYTQNMFLKYKIVFDYFMFMVISISNGNDHSIETEGNGTLYNLYKTYGGLHFVKIGNVYDNPEMLNSTTNIPKTNISNSYFYTNSTKYHPKPLI